MLLCKDEGEGFPWLGASAVLSSLLFSKWAMIDGMTGAMLAQVKNIYLHETIKQR